MLQWYNVMFLYHLGKNMYLVDTLSGVYVQRVSRKYDADDIGETKYIPDTDRKQIELWSAMVILTGWPIDKLHHDTEVRPYFSFQHGMIAQDGIPFRESRVLVPTIERVKEKLYFTHLEVDICHMRTRERLSWSNMNSDIRD